MRFARQPKWTQSMQIWFAALSLAAALGVLTVAAAPGDQPRVRTVEAVPVAAPAWLNDSVLTGTASTQPLDRVLRRQGVPNSGGPWQVRTDGPSQIALIHEQSFDGSVFPPEGWNTFDALARENGAADSVTWDRETCTSASAPAMAWSGGGGAKGTNYACGGRITDGAISVLRYGPIDTRPFPDGIQVNLRFRLDSPTAPTQSLLAICAPVPGRQTQDCRGPTNRFVDPWSRFADPLLFDDVGGEAEVYIVFSYEDRQPDGQHWGAMIDDVIIEGIRALPTATASPTPAPRPTIPASLRWMEIYHDDFSNPASGWGSENGSEEMREYRAGQYHHQIRQALIGRAEFNRLVPMLSLNRAVEVSAHSPGIGARLIGLALGRDLPAVTYNFTLDPINGTYSLQSGAGGHLVAPSFSPAIRLGDATNKLRVEHLGKSFVLMVNDVYLTTVELSSLPDWLGGLAAFNLSGTVPVDAYFDDFRIEELVDVNAPTPTRTPVPPTAIPVTPTATPFRTPTPRFTATPPVVDPGAPNLIHVQRFDRPQFPPPGWRAIDALAGPEGRAARFMWNRTTCTANSPSGSAWAIGGGNGGSLLGCGDATGEQVTSQLTFGPFDTLAYPGGLQVRLALKQGGAMASVSEEAGTLPFFAVCVGEDGEQDPLCYLATGDSEWRFTTKPIMFQNHGGLRDLTLYLIYANPAPDGAHSGVWIDDVIIEGLQGDPPPTAGPTLPAPATPPRGGTRLALLPFVARSARLDELPLSTPTIKGLASVEFGAGVDAGGRLIEPGSIYQHGVRSLVGRIRYQDVAPGTYLQWEWYRDDRPVEVEGLRGRRPIDDRSGVLDVPVRSFFNDPLPVGRYLLAVHLGFPSELATIGEARIQYEPPAGATPRPATPVPPPTMVAGPTPETPRGCIRLPQNGDFEAGELGWTFKSNSAEPSERELSGVLNRGYSPTTGQWLALLLAVSNRWNELTSAPFDLPEAAALTKATLEFDYKLTTNEIPDSDEDDRFEVQIVNPDRADELESIGTFSEESVRPNNWYRSDTMDVMPVLTRQPGWSRAALRFTTRGGDDPLPSLFALDRVVLTICGNVGAAAPMPWATVSGPFRLDLDSLGRGLRLNTP